jgi:hypothetical protein
MSTEPVRGRHDVYLSYPSADLAWAERLIRDLGEKGVRTFFDHDVAATANWQDALNEALDNSAALIVLWTPAATASRGILGEIGAFQALMRQDEHRRLLPLVLGGSEAMNSLPPNLASVRAIVIGPEPYAAGADADSDEWQRAVEQIVEALQTIPAEQAATWPSFSTQSLRALTYAAEMLRHKNASEAQLRTAALLGSLLASASDRMTPTTGDVVKLVLERQRDGRPAEPTLTAAALAAGLQPVDGRERPQPIEMLAESAVRTLVSEAAEAQQLTRSDAVHLRHVLATGAHPAVPLAVLSELGVTMDELRQRWRESIAETWPGETWDAVLAGPSPDAARRSTAPPSARVHADRWTTEDQLDYRLYARAITEFIKHEDAKPPMVISVQAPWGQGKTSLMRMVQKNLDPGHPDLVERARGSGGAVDEPPPTKVTYRELRKSLSKPETPDTKPTGIRTVWFNAWKYQSSDQIWAGLAHAILAQLPARLSPKDRELFWLRLQITRIDPSAVRSDIHRAVIERFVPLLIGAVAALVLIGVAVLLGDSHVDGAGVAGAGLLGTVGATALAWTKATRDVLNRPLEGAYVRYVRQPDYASKLGYLHLVEEDMVQALDLLTPDDQPAVIFIDDLDRCSPQNIAEVIEAVNLFLAGDYPNCAFVIGIDAEVVAAAMEVVHSDIIGKLEDRRGELGWRFMDKFVQLPFVMPRLHTEQREAYLRGLFATPRDVDVGDVEAEARRLEGQLNSRKLAVDEVDHVAQQVGELAPRLAEVDPDRARALGEQVVTAGAQAFSDNDAEVVDALAAQLLYLSDNPRTIKRAVNLYRFHRFAAYARQTTVQQLKIATPEQIGRWIVVIIRWPHFVRWLQTQRDGDEDVAEVAVSGIVSAARKADTVTAFEEAMKAGGIDASWIDDSELWEFLRSATAPDLELSLAGPRGLW